MANGISPRKVSAIASHQQNNVIQEVYAIHGHTLKTTDSVKYLAVELHNKLRWQKHIRSTARKAGVTRAFLQWNIWDTKAQFYSTLVRPIMEYANTVLEPHIQKDIDFPEKTQLRSARFIYQYFQRTSSVTQMMMTQLGWGSLAECCAKAKVTMMSEQSMVWCASQCGLIWHLWYQPPEGTL